MNLGVYIQVPFCQTRCTYCNFHTSIVSGARFAPYATAVQTEIREHQSRLTGAGIDLPTTATMQTDVSRRLVETLPSVHCVPAGSFSEAP